MIIIVVVLKNGSLAGSSGIPLTTKNLTACVPTENPLWPIVRILREWVMIYTGFKIPVLLNANTQGYRDQP
jgi:hypothetical protein